MELGGFYTLRDIGGEMRVVRKSMSPRKCSKYWKDVINVENELREWMRKHKTLNRLPKHRELKETGCFSLSHAIVCHGGMSAFSTKQTIDFIEDTIENAFQVERTVVCQASKAKWLLGRREER